MALLDAIAEQAPFGVYVDEPTRGCVYANPALLAQFGLDWESFAGFGWARHVLPADAERLAEAIKRYEVDLEPINVTYRVRGQDGGVRWVHARVQAVLDPSGTHVGSVGLTQDVTGERDLRAHLADSQRREAVGRLAARIAHDFNNLLGVMLVSSSLIEPKDAKSEEFLGSIQVAVEHARLITSRLLVLAKGSLSAGGVSCLDAELARLEPLLSRTLGEGISLEVLLEAPERFVPLDAGQIGQVVLNLATNGRDAMAGTGTLSVRTLEAGDAVKLEVSDSGTGMSAETLARAFDAFYTTKDPGRGTGLGLASLKDLVDLAGGEVEVESAPGQGTKVSVTLPVVTGGLGTSATRRARVEAKGAQVLFVEDHDALRQSLAYALALSGFKVETARTLAGAREAFAAQVPAVLVADVLLPDGESPSWVAELRRDHPNLPVVFCSGFTGEAGEALPPGPHTQLLGKPFRPAELLEAIEAVMAAAPAPEGE